MLGRDHGGQHMAGEIVRRQHMGVEHLGKSLDGCVDREFLQMHAGIVDEDRGRSPVSGDPLHQAFGFVETGDVGDLVDGRGSHARAGLA